MKITSRRFSVLVVLWLGMIVTGCGLQASTSTPASALATRARKPDIRGEITAVSRAGGKIQAVHVEGDLAGGMQYDRASVRITEQTRVFRLAGDGYEAMAVDQLRVGQTVEALFTGIVRERDPVSAEAEELLVIP
ncbi:MAG: hypothetical protein AB1894_11700 [Chloroflexota bacterium]